ncbi:YHYH protein, partial [Rhodococcus sp. BS-15]|uniref:YHYH protein n=1 Tax=Rhodococcus sp. BS-15 TaxID=1304954 RepID=UPI000FFB325F
PDGTFHLQALIPVTPEKLDSSTSLSTISQVGLALDGITIFGDAPSVADRGGLPALDSCGGHIDPSGYYHWHFGAESIQANLDEAGISETCAVDQDAEALIGLAYDGYGIYGPEEDRDIPTDLDECSGHVSETEEFGEIYHYHLTYDSPNLPGCMAGATAESALSSPDNDQAALPGGSGGGREWR